MAANREDVEKIIKTVPGFYEKWRDFLREWGKEDSPPYYLGMGELAHYLVEKYSKGETAEFSELFAAEVENLIVVGLLEDIQNVASHRDFGAAPFREWLGPKTIVAWEGIPAYLLRSVKERGVTHQGRASWLRARCFQGCEGGSEGLCYEC